ncbi:MAG: EAL domain-containing protein [Deltaproteobacteria bacterium]|nr:EAL domain-containing protein [Candidatus Anaeroferrophillacea bacterium]
MKHRKRRQDLLRQKEAELHSLAAKIPGNIVRFDTAGRYLYINPAHERTIAQAFSEVIGTPVPDTRTEIKDAIARVCESGGLTTVRQNYVADDGRMKVHDFTLVPETDAHGKIVSVLGIGYDVTDIVRLQEALAEKEKQFRTLVENLPDNVARHDTACRLIYASPSLEQVLGPGSIARLLGKTPVEVDPEDIHLFARSQQAIEEVIATGEKREIEVSYTSFTNEPFHHLIRFVPEYDTGGVLRSVLAIGTDITRLKEAHLKIEHLARHDSLTGLPNRLTVAEQTDRAIAFAQRHGGKVALLFVDLDNFKAINDTLGHAIGDMLLIEVSQRLKSCVREIDVVGRQGGDEFVIALPEVDDADAVAAIVSRIFRQFDQPIIAEGHTLSVHMSIGIALYPDDGDSCVSLMKMADTAMYEAKRAGRNTSSFFSEQMNRATSEHLTMQSDLKRALAANELCLHYQPQVDAMTGAITGAEALLRWEHPGRGLIPPLQFIPLAESSGLIIPIGKWIIEQACRQAASWHARGMNLSVAVNISAVQFKRGDLVETVKQALDASDLQARFLELELTESLIMQDTDTTLDAVRELKDLGVKLSLDDFGTGYSSLAYLKRFAVDKLKIDRCFIRDITHDADDAAIVQAIIQMAKTLGIATVAEGVEDQKNLELLKRLGCDFIQGFLFSPALKATDFGEFHRQYSAGQPCRASSRADFPSTNPRPCAG